jgi:hypothetical protein
MQQFVIPQFIDVEDKIIGPITVRQFLIMMVGGGIVFLLFRLLTFTFFLISGVPIGAATLVFAFIRVNGRPMHYFLLVLLETLRRPRLRAWNRSDVRALPKVKEKKVDDDSVPVRQPLSKSRLAELALVVDTGGRYDEPTEE